MFAYLGSVSNASVNRRGGDLISLKECERRSGMPRMTVYWTYVGAMRRLSLELTWTEEFWNDPYFEQIICDELCLLVAKNIAEGIQMPKLPHTYKRRAFKVASHVSAKPLLPSGRPRGGKNEGQSEEEANRRECQDA